MTETHSARDYELEYRGSVESHQGDKVKDYWTTQIRHRDTGEVMVTAVVDHNGEDVLLLCRISSLRACAR